MFWTLLALLMWVVLGGFISYYGDLQGRRWGKKRVSWMGMRPKHTAILITSLTGGFIALGSVICLLAVSPRIRDVMLRGERAIHENKVLIASQQRQQLVDRLALEKNTKERVETDHILAEGRFKVSQMQVRLNDKQASLNDKLAKLMLLQLKLSITEPKVVRLESKSRTLVQKNHELDVINDNVTAINKVYANQNTLIVKSNIDLTKSNAGLIESNSSLKALNEDLTNKGEKQKQSNDAIYLRSAELDKQTNALESQVAEMTHDREEAMGLIRQRDQLVEQINTLNQEIRQKYAVLRTGHVILGAGVELGRLTIDSHLRPDAIKKQLGALLAAAAEQARTYGAAPDHGSRAALLLPQRQVTLTGFEDRDESSQLDLLASQWSGQDVAFVVVATTVANCLAGEPAFVELHPYRVARVFAKGAEVASRVIDGHKSVDSIITELMAFLQKDVKEAAIRAGTIPRIDPESGATEVGVLGTADLVRLTDRVRRMRGPVMLSAHAKTDLSSADQLNLTFHISRLASDSQTLQTP